MNGRLWLAVVTLACLGTGCESRHSLTGEPLHNSDKVTQMTRMSLVGGRLQIRGPQGQVEAPLEVGMDAASEWTIGQVSGRRLDRLELLVTKVRLVTKMTIDGEAVEEVTASPIEGLAAEFSRNVLGGPWTKRLAPRSRDALSRDQELLRAVEEDIAATEPWDPMDEMYPADKVKVGQEWIKSGADLRPLLGMNVLSVEGEARFKVADFIEFKGLTCARITVHLSTKGAMLDPILGKMEFSMGGTGTIIRSVKHGLDLLIAINGSMEQSTTIPVDGGMAHVQITGPIAFEHSTSLSRFSSTDRSDTAANLSATDLTSLLELAQKSGGTPPPRVPALGKPPTPKMALPPISKVSPQTAKAAATIIRKVLTKGR
jgi:hypothetical protein